MLILAQTPLVHLFAADDPTGGLSSMLIPLILIGFVFYFVILLPEKRKRADTDRMLQNLKKNDRVVTIGGIVGTVVNAPQGQDEVTIRVDESSNTRLRVLRSAVSKVLSSDDVKEAEKPA